jgi:hypothetical protein
VRALIISGLLAITSPAWAQRPSIPVTAHPVLGLDVEGAAPFGDFGNSASFGFQFAFRAGVDLILGPGAYIAPDGEINFVRFGAHGAAELGGLDSAIGVGFMLGGRFGYEFKNIATPFFDLHFGYYHAQATGRACDLPASNCGSDKFGMEWGFGSTFWLSPSFGIGPLLKFNYDFTDNVTANWFTFTADLVFRI